MTDMDRIEGGQAVKRALTGIASLWQREAA